MNLWTVYLSLIALLLPPIDETRLVVLQHDDYIIKAHIAIDKSEIKTQNELVYHYFQRGRILESQGDFVGHLLDGDITKTLIDNTLVEKGFFTAGLKDGIWKSWNRNGQLKTSEQWKKGRKDGAFEHYDEKGLLSEKGIFKDNLKNGKVERFQDGALLETIAYKEGKEIFKTRAKTPSKAYPQNGKRGSPDAIVTENTESKPSAPIFKVSLNYTDKANSQPIADVSVMISNLQTGEMQRKMTNTAGQIDFAGPQGTYSFQAALEPYEVDIAQIALVAPEQYVWIELTKGSLCQNMTYALRNNEGAPINSKTEVQIKNLRSNKKETVITANSQIEACLMCGERYQFKMFNDDHEYTEGLVVLDPNCSKNQELFVLNKIEVAPKIKPATRPLALNQPPAPRISGSSVPPSRSSEQPQARPRESQPSISSSASTSASVGGQGEFYVVVGTFGDEANAQKRLANLQAKGYNNGSMLRNQSSGLWSVYAERYDNYDAAKHMERQIERTGDFKVFVKILE